MASRMFVIPGFQIVLGVDFVEFVMDREYVQHDALTTLGLDSQVSCRISNG